MCYALLLSTTAGSDLSQFNGEKLRFDKTIPDRLSSGHLLYPNQWYVGSRTGCSCSFRHLYTPDLGFGVPVDWFPEERADIEATLMFIRLVRSVVVSGEKVDCIDLWESNAAEPLPPMPVDLNKVLDEEFRFFENHHFDFVVG
jgi:hypothetical protein